MAEVMSTPAPEHLPVGDNVMSADDTAKDSTSTCPTQSADVDSAPKQMDTTTGDDHATSDHDAPKEVLPYCHASECVVYNILQQFLANRLSI